MPKRIKVLIADSDLDALSKIYLSLIHKAYMVEATDNGDEITARIERFKPHIVILSTSTKNITDEVHKKLKQKKLPVILLVDNLPITSESILRKIEIIKKPVDLNSIDSKIKEMLNILL